MSIQTIIGLISGIVFIVIGIFLDGSIMSFVDLPSIMIVFGGTIASTLISFDTKQVKNLLPMIKLVFTKTEESFDEDIERIIKLANIARREGLLALENEEFDDPFLEKGVELIVDGTDPELVKDILETEIDYTADRHKSGQEMLGVMAQYAPAYGMISTLIGLINMLKKLDDVNSLGPSMAVALVTTFYGVILANLLFLPMANKLKGKSNHEILKKEMFVEGMLSIQNGENPRIIKDKLEAFIARKKNMTNPVEEKPNEGNAENE